MSLDVALLVNACSHCRRGDSVYEANITHNLNYMADAAGIYGALWRPDEHGYTYAKDIVPVLQEGLAKMIADPATYRQYDAVNGWGTYDDFVPWILRYLEACEQNPDAVIEVSR